MQDAIFYVAADGESRHAVQQPGDAFLLMRVDGAGCLWSDAIRLPHQI